MLNYTLNAKIQVKLMIGIWKNQTEFSAKKRLFSELLLRCWKKVV